MQSADGDGRAILAAHDAFKRVHRLRLPVVDALKIRPVPNRPVHRKRADAEHALEFVDQLQWIFHRAITLVHEREDRHAALAADLEQLPGLWLDAFGGINHHDDGVHGGQHAIGVLGEVFVAGSVEQVETVAVVVELQHGGADRDAALLLQLHPVGGGGALVLARGHGAGELHGTAVEQELFGERRLAGIRMRDDGERAASLNFFRDVHRNAEASRGPDGNQAEKDVNR